MFDWLRRRDAIRVDAHTPNINAKELFFIRKASRMMPQWWSDLPRYRDLHPMIHNMRGCTGLLDYYRHSYVLLSWCDIFVDRTLQSTKTYDKEPVADFKIEIITAVGEPVVHHLPHQYGGFIKQNEWHHVKIPSPWYIEHQQPLKWVWSQPSWSLNEFMSDIIILPGIMDFSQQPETNINMLIRKAPGSFVIPANTPLVHMIPMTDRDIDLQCHGPNPRLDVLTQRGPFTFRNRMRARLKIKKDLDKDGSCPFH